MEDQDLRARIERGTAFMERRSRAAAVAVTLVSDKLGTDRVVLEVRAHDLKQQPGEVCCPGGHVEPSETPAEAVIRETCEELLVEPDQMTLIDALGTIAGPGGLPLHVFVTRLEGYHATFAEEEVASVFTIPLEWLLEHEPAFYEVAYEPNIPDDFPWKLVPGGRSYHWQPRTERVPFYDTDPVIWGATARVLWLFARVMRAGA